MDKDELRERYEATGDKRFYDEAVPLYEDALARSPDDSILLRDYGYLQECRGRYAIRTAIEYYRRAVTADPLHEKAHFQLIGALRSLGDLEDVVPDYEQQLVDTPDQVSSYRELASAYLGVGQYAKADSTIRAGLAVAPDDPALVELEGDVYAATDRPDEALATWRRAFELAPADYGISMRFSQAFLLEKLGRLEEAADEWRYIISWSEADEDDIHIEWPRSTLRGLEARLAEE